MNYLLIQYVAVFLILGGVIAWVIYKLVKKGDNQSSPCCGCGIANACSKKHHVSVCDDRDKDNESIIKK